MNKKELNDFYRRLANELSRRYVYFEHMKSKEIDSTTLYVDNLFSATVDATYTMTLVPKDNLLYVTLCMNVYGTEVWREFKLNIKTELAIYNTDKRKGIDDFARRIGHHRVTSGFISNARKVIEHQYDQIEKARSKM